MRHDATPPPFCHPSLLGPFVRCFNWAHYQVAVFLPHVGALVCIVHHTLAINLWRLYRIGQRQSRGKLVRHQAETHGKQCNARRNVQ
jgi:hypothetical protein